VLTSEAEAVLSRYYELQRQTDTRNQARTTLRLLESLVRLTQAHARIMCKDEASLQDAVVAVVLVETSMHTSAMLGVDSVLHSSFPEVRCCVVVRLGMVCDFGGCCAGP